VYVQKVLKFESPRIRAIRQSAPYHVDFNLFLAAARPIFIFILFFNTLLNPTMLLYVAATLALNN
jgi:hypothetical protein